MLQAAIKAWAGYGWCLLEPNKFTHWDFLTFKDGRPTPERMSAHMMHNHWLEHSPVAVRGTTYSFERRRLATSNAWLYNFLPILFPYAHLKMKLLK